MERQGPDPLLLHANPQPKQSHMSRYISRGIRNMNFLTTDSSRDTVKDNVYDSCCLHAQTIPRGEKSEATECFQTAAFSSLSAALQTERPAPPHSTRQMQSPSLEGCQESCWIWSGGTTTASTAHTHHTNVLRAITIC